MTKIYCDCCKKELRTYNSPRGGRNSSDRMGTKVGKGLDVEILILTNGISNHGDYCKYCILDALYKLDNRKKNG